MSDTLSKTKGALPRWTHLPQRFGPWSFTPPVKTVLDVLQHLYRYRAPECCCGPKWAASEHVCHRLHPGWAHCSATAKEVALKDRESCVCFPLAMEYIHSSRYRAPEVLLRARRYGPPVDMFAMGCILEELITLRPLLPGSSEVCTLHPPHMLWWCFSLCAHLSWAAFWSELITQRPLLS